MVNEDRYIKIKVSNLAGGDKWVHKPTSDHGTLIFDRNLATLFTEMEAFDMRAQIISQVPKDVTVSFDLES